MSSTVTLLRLALRRDRAMVTLWLVALLAVCYASAAATSSVYVTEADRVQAAQAINASPGIVALYGPIVDVRSAGELAMTKMTVLYAVFVALMLLFVVRRHTRGDEEAGQAELLGGTAITRTAPLTAALAFGTGLSVLLGALAALVVVLGGLPVQGSLAFGASWAGTGLVAAALTGLACQVSPSARTCAAVAVVAIAALFGLRAVGDTTSASWLSWLTPFGWNTRLHAFSDTRWWVLLLYVGLAGLLGAAAVAVQRGRDLGSGLTQPRPGATAGSPRLASAATLTLRVHRAALAGWSLGMLVLGLVFGAIAPSFDRFDSGSLHQLLERLGGVGTLRDTLLAAVLSVVAVVVTGFAMSVITHAAGDEANGRTEEVLATATARSQLFVATAGLAVTGAVWLLLVTGVGLAIGTWGHTVHSMAELVGSALAQAPAVTLVVAVGFVAYSFRSGWSMVGWGAIVLFTTLGQLGALLELPSWVVDLSPYTHAPRMPLEQFAPGPAAALLAIAGALFAFGWTGYRRRDLA